MLSVRGMAETGYRYEIGKTSPPGTTTIVPGGLGYMLFRNE